MSPSTKSTGTSWRKTCWLSSNLAFIPKNTPPSPGSGGLRMSVRAVRLLDPESQISNLKSQIPDLRSQIPCLTTWFPERTPRPASVRRLHRWPASRRLSGCGFISLMATVALGIAFGYLLFMLVLQLATGIAVVGWSGDSMPVHRDKSPGPYWFADRVLPCACHWCGGVARGLAASAKKKPPSLGDGGLGTRIVLCDGPGPGFEISNLKS